MANATLDCSCYPEGHSRSALILQAFSALARQADQNYAVDVDLTDALADITEAAILAEMGLAGMKFDSQIQYVTSATEVADAAATLKEKWRRFAGNLHKGLRLRDGERIEVTLRLPDAITVRMADRFSCQQVSFHHGVGK